MTSSIHDTCKKLLDRNCNLGWVWSMLLGQGLTWDNVWEAFPDGVLTNSKYYKNGIAVPSPHMLLSLPNAPTNIVEVFKRLEEIDRTYPYRGHKSYDFLSRDNLSQELIRATHGFVQCTWPQIKEVLDSTKTGHGASKSNLREFFNLLDDQEMLHECLVYMIQEQHAFTDTQAFSSYVHSGGQKRVDELWFHAKDQHWAEPERMVSFLSAYALSGNKNAMGIPAMEALAFIEKYPQILHAMAQSIERYGTNNRGDHLFFEKASKLLANHSEYVASLAYSMKKTVPLTVLDAWDVKKSKFEVKPLLQMYIQMEPGERDSHDAAKKFGQLFSKAPSLTEEHFNGDSNNLMTQITTEHPTGTVTRILALHACIVGLHPEGQSDKSIQQLKAMFKHDPRSNTGYANIIKKYLPDMKAWLGIVDSIGLLPKDIWEQGLYQLTNPRSSSDLDIDLPLMP